MDNAIQDRTVVVLQKSITLRIPRDYHNEAVIGSLIGNYGLRVNIRAASLGEEDRSDGWFKLELWGTKKQLQLAANYLRSLKVEVWNTNQWGYVEESW